MQHATISSLTRVWTCALLQWKLTFWVLTTGSPGKTQFSIFQMKLNFSTFIAIISKREDCTSCWAQFSSVTQSCLILCEPVDCSMPDLPVHHQLLGFTQTHVHWVSDAIQPPHPLPSTSPPALNLSQHQGLFKWVNSSHQVAKVLEFKLQHQSFQ